MCFQIRLNNHMIRRQFLKSLFAVPLALGLVGLVLGQEKAALIIPDQSVTGTSEWRVSLIHLNIYEKRIIIGLRGHNGTNWTSHVKTVEYTEDVAVTLIKSLNTADMSKAGNSLNSIILKRLKTDGHLAIDCTIVTTPQP